MYYVSIIFANGDTPFEGEAESVEIGQHDVSLVIPSGASMFFERHSIQSTLVEEI